MEVKIEEKKTYGEPGGEERMLYQLFLKSEGKEMGEKGISRKRGGKKSRRRPSLFYKLYGPHLSTPISLHVQRKS